MQNGPTAVFRWDDARILLALLETRTLSGAGTELGVNTSTIGRRLEALEEALGARLFDRTPDGVLPTAFAEELAPYAESLQRSALDFAMAAAGRELHPEGEVRVSAPPGVAENLLAPALPRLVARFPKLRIAIDATIGYADLTRGEADLAMRLVPPEHGDLVMKKLGESQDTLLASKAYAAELGTLRNLDDVRFIGWGRDLSHIPSAQWLAKVAPSGSVVLRTSSIGAKLSAIEAGLGVALLGRPFAHVKNLVEVTMAPALERKLPPRPSAALWLVGHRALRNVPRVAAVWTFLEEEGGRVLSSMARRTPRSP